MKKSLIALAVLAACGAAFAQTTPLAPPTATTVVPGIAPGTLGNPTTTPRPAPVVTAPTTQPAPAPVKKTYRK